MSMSPEDIAQALTENVSLETRKCKKSRKKFKKCFKGTEAVDILMELTQFEDREQALELGRTLQYNYDLFECVNSKKAKFLEDDKRLLYRFSETTTNGTRGKSEQMVKNLEDKMRSFQRGVRIKDRSLRLTNYKQCFVGKSIVGGGRALSYVWVKSGQHIILTLSPCASLHSA